MRFNFTPDVMVVDDRLENLDLLRGVLSKLDLNLELNQSPVEAAQMIEEKEYALIILDIQMPELDGFTLAEKIRSGNKNKNTPIIFLTAFYLDKESEQRGYECGCADFILKPFNPIILRSKISIFLDLYNTRKKQEIQNKKLSSALKDKELFENRLKNLATNYRTIIEGQNELILKVDSSLKIEFANKAFTDFFDYNLDGVSINSIAEINSQLSDQIVNAIKQMNGKKQSIIVEKPIQNHLSEQKWLEWSIFKQIEFDEMHYHIVGRDVSDKKLLEDSLIKKELMMRKIQKFTRVGSFEYDSCSAVLKGSTEFYRIYEITETEIDNVLDQIKHKFHPEDLITFNDLFSEPVKSSRKLELKHRIFTQANKIRHIHIELNVEYNATLDVLNYNGIAWDITKDIEMQNTFKNSLGFERKEYGDRAYIELNSQNEIIYINDFGSKLLEFNDSGEQIIRNFINLVHKDDIDKAKECFNFSEQKKEFVFDTFTLALNNNQLKQVVLVAFPFKNKTDNGVRILMNELPKSNTNSLVNEKYQAVISDIKQKDQELNDQAVKLQDTNNHDFFINEYQRQLLTQKSELETLGKMASCIVNEINQPLSGISMIIDNILLRLTKDSIDKKYIEDKCVQVFKDIDRIKAYLSQIGIFNSSQNESCNDSVDVNNVVLDAVNMVKKQYKHSNVDIDLKIDPDKLFICGNKYKLQKVIVDILNNSYESVGEKIKKSENKELADDGIQIKTKLSNNEVVVSIRDFGEGIEKKNLNYIFEPFFSTKKENENSGLSLYVSKNIIQKMNGEIKVRSKKNKFTEMRLIFPYKQKEVFLKES